MLINLKTHLIVNDQGELLAFCFTPGNVDDRKPVPDMAKGLFGKLFVDKGYISQKLSDFLYANGIQLKLTSNSRSINKGWGGNES